MTVLKQGFNVDPLLQKQAACISTMTYNEYWQVIDAGIKAEDLVTFKYEDEGVATLEDGLYVLEDKLADPAFKEKMVKFVRASMKGWKYAEANSDEAAEIVLENDASGAQTEQHQKRMMSEVAKLTAGSNGALDKADYDRTVKTLLGGGSDPVISKEPTGAFTTEITDAAPEIVLADHIQTKGTESNLRVFLYVLPTVSCSGDWQIGHTTALY